MSVGYEKQKKKETRTTQKVLGHHHVQAHLQSFFKVVLVAPVACYTSDDTSSA